MFLGKTLSSIQREMKIGTLNFRSLYRAGPLKGAQKEQGIMIFYTGKEMKIINWEHIFCTP